MGRSRKRLGKVDLSRVDTKRLYRAGSLMDITVMQDDPEEEEFIEIRFEDGTTLEIFLHEDGRLIAETD